MNITVFVNPQQVASEYWDAVITNMSEDDKAGIEFALKLKEKIGGEVTAVAIGMEDADLALREAFAMGVDRAAVMNEEEASTEKIIAALQKVGGDVFVSGRQDDEMKKVAAALNAPEKQGTEIEMESFFGPAPCFVFATREDFKPRHMSVGGVYSAYLKELENIPVLESAPVLGMVGSL